MTNTLSNPIVQEILESLHALTLRDQERVLAYTQGLVATTPVGTPGRDLLQFAGTIDPHDLEKMSQAIEKDCERIDGRDW